MSTLPSLLLGHMSCILGPGEVAEVEDFELAEGDFDTQGAGVFGLVGGAGLGGLAEFVGLAGSGQTVRR